MPSVNKVILIGNLGRDPEIKYTPSGAAVANFSIAVNEKWKGKDGKTEERTEWVKIVAWNKLAEICGEYLSKGRPVFVEGRLQTREYEAKDGGKRYVTEVVAQSIQFLGGGDGKASGRTEQSEAATMEIDEDIPFAWVVPLLTGGFTAWLFGNSQFLS